MKPVNPTSQVQVFKGSAYMYPDPYLHVPARHTHTGFQTCDIHYMCMALDDQKC
jgi:hypothetical protein